MSLIGKLLGLLHPEHKNPLPLQEDAQVFRPPQADDAHASSFRVPGQEAENVSVQPILGEKEKAAAATTPSPSTEMALPTTPQSIMERRKAVEELVSVRLAGTIAEGARFTIPTLLKQNSGPSRLHWVTPGEALEVQGIQLSCGLLYTGLDTHGDEPSMIHSKWPIERVSNQSSENLPYNPSYASLTPSQRFRYLDWLGKGARDPGVDPGFAILRLFGLERRLILEDACVAVEAAMLLTEIERLQQLFGGNWALFGSAHRLKHYVYLRRELANPTEELPPVDAASSFEVPISIAFGLGRFAKQGAPLPVEWALRWALTDPMISRRTAVERCPKEFAAAFTASYMRRFGDGIKLPQNKTHLKYRYRASSRSVTGSRLEVALGDLPDVTAVQGPRKKLQEVVEEGTQQIDSYSRFVGRYQEKAGSIEAYLTLPLALWPSDMRERIEALRDRAAEMRPATFAELLTQLGHMDEPTPSLARDLATVLTSLQLGFEPDVLEGARRPAAGDKVVFFPLTRDTHGARDTGAYRNASTAVSLMAILSLADGHASEPELQAVERRITSWQNLAPDLCTRLRAQYRLQVEQPPALASIKSRLASCDELERLNIGRALAAVANADRAATPDEVRLLEQLYRALRLDPQLVYRHLYEQEGDTLPLERTPLLQASADKTMALDTKRIARLEQETAQVAELLASVFREEEEENAQPLVELDKTRDRESSSHEIFSARPELNGTDRKKIAVIASVPEGPVTVRSTATATDRALTVEEQSRLTSVLTILDDYVRRPFDETLTKYLVDYLMHADHVIAWSYLSRRVPLDPAFRQHPFGLSAALRDTVNTLQAQGVLGALDNAAVGERYGSTGQAFAITSKPTSAEVTPEGLAAGSHKAADDCATLCPMLDSKHAQLLDRLLTRPQWSREELLQLASELELMLDGALEQINEAALDLAGTMVLDGENPVFVDQTFLENFNS